MHEQSQTIERDGRYFNVSGVTGATLEGPFDALDTAVQSARKRSASFSEGNITETYPRLTPKIETARAAGYSDQEIQGHLQQKMQTAFKAGYSQDEVNAYLGEIPKPSIMEPIKGSAKELGRLTVSVAPAILGAAAGTAAVVPALPVMGPAALALPFVGGAAGGAGGEALAQYFFDDKISPKQIALQAAFGLIPGVKLGQFATPGARVAIRSGEGALMGGGATAASRAIEGEDISANDVLKGSLMGALFGTVVGGREGKGYKPERKLTKDQEARIDAIATELTKLERLRQSPQGRDLLKKELTEMEAKGEPARQAELKLEENIRSSEIDADAYLQEIGPRRGVKPKPQDAAYTEATGRTQERALIEEGVLPQRRIPAEEAEAEVSRLGRFLDVAGKPPYLDPPGTPQAPTRPSRGAPPAEGIEAQVARLETENANLREQTAPTKAVKPTEPTPDIVMTKTAEPSPDSGSINQNATQPDGFAVKLKDGTVVSDLWAKSHADLMEKHPQVDVDNVAAKGDGYVVNGKFVAKGEMAPDVIAKGLHDARNAAMDADAAVELAKLRQMTPEERTTYFESQAQARAAEPPADPIRSMPVMDLIKKALGTETGAIGKLSEEQAAAERIARASRAELFRRIGESAKTSGKTLAAAADEMGVSNTIFRRLALETRIDQATSAMDKAYEKMSDLNERARMVIPEAEDIATKGTLAKESREPFREDTGAKPETYRYRISEADVDRTRLEAQQAARTYTAALDALEKSGDPASSIIGQELQRQVIAATKEMNKQADVFHKQRFAAGRTVGAYNRPAFSADVIAAYQRAGVLLEGLRNPKNRVPIDTNIVESLKRWDDLTPGESVQLRRDLVDSVRLNLFAPTSFTLDLISNLAETGAQVSSGLMGDMVHIARGNPSMPALTGMWRAIQNRRRVGAVEEKLGYTYAGEPIPGQISLGDLVNRPSEMLKGNVFQTGKQGIFTERSTQAAAAYDTIKGSPLYAKGAVDTGFKRFAANMTIWREAAMAADKQGLKGVDRQNFFNDYWKNIPDSVIEQAATDANKAGFNRPLTKWEESFSRNKFVQLFGEAFARWPFQFARWSSEMMGYNPALLKKFWRMESNPEEIARYLGRTATGIGGMYLIDQMFYDRVDFNSMELIEPNGDRKRLSGREPLPTALFMLAVAHGDVDKATAGLRYASVPFAKMLYGEGGVLGNAISTLAGGFKQGKLTTKQLTKELEDTLNRAIPGQAVLSVLKTVIDPQAREGVGANLPGVSFLKDPIIDLSTGQPLDAKQRMFGVEVPSIAGTPIPGATRVMQPVAQVLARYGMMTYRGPRLPIAGYRASDAPDDVTRAWEIEFGKARKMILSQAIPAIEAAETKVPKEQLKPQAPFYEKIRKTLQTYDSMAARHATAIINQRYAATGKLPRQTSVRERRAPTEAYQ